MKERMQEETSNITICEKRRILIPEVVVFWTQMLATMQTHRDTCLTCELESIGLAV